MDAEPVHIGIDADHGTVMLHNVVVNRIRMQMFGEDLRDVVLHGPEECSLKIILVFGFLQVLRDESLGFEAHWRSEEHTSELQSQSNLVCRLLLEKKKKYRKHPYLQKKITYNPSNLNNITHI